MSRRNLSLLCICILVANMFLPLGNIKLAYADSLTVTSAVYDDDVIGSDALKLAVNFEHPGETATYFDTVGTTVTDSVYGEIISGNGSLVLEAPEGSSYVKVLNLKAGHLQTNIKYTAVFKYKPLVEYPGTMFMVTLGPDNAYPLQFENRTIVRWTSMDPYQYSFHDNGDYALLRYTFTTDGTPNRDIRLMIDAGGKIAIDDFRLYEGDYIPPVSNMNLSPLHTENFDIVASDSFKLSPDQAAYINDEHRINGNGSLIGSSGSEWTFAETDPTVMRLAPNTAYTVTFKYMGTEPLTPGEFYHVTMWSDTGGFPVHKYIRWIDGGVITEGSLIPYHAHFVERDGIGYGKITFETGAFNDFKLQFGVNSAHTKLVIDDVRIFEGQSYTSEPNLYDPISRPPIYTERFEDGNIYNSLFDPGIGNIEFRLAHLINGNYSYAASSSGGDWVQVLRSNPAKLIFEPNGNYTLTFRLKNVMANGAGGFYQVSIDNSDFTGSAYLRFDGSGALVEGTRVSNFQVMEVDGVLEVTATFHLENFNDYILNFLIHQGGGYIIDDIRIFNGVFPASQDIPAVPVERVFIPLYTERFESGDMQDSLFQIHQGSLVNRLYKLINGNYSFASSAAAGPYVKILNTDPMKVTFKANSVYTVSFRLKDLEAPPPGGFYQISLDSDTDTTKAESAYLRFDAAGNLVESRYVSHFTFVDGDPIEVSASFSTGNYDDYVLNIYIHEGGSFTLDDVRIFEGPFYSADIDVKTEELDVTPVYIERFENRATSSWLFYPDWGTVSTKKPNILNGMYSFVSYAPITEWQTILTQRADRVFLKPDTNYTMSFRYKVLEEAEPDGFFMITAKSGIGGLANDKYVRFSSDGSRLDGNEISFSAVDQGDYYDAVFTFRTGNFDDTLISFVTNTRGKLLIDDLRIFEGYFITDDIAIEINEQPQPIILPPSPPVEYSESAKPTIMERFEDINLSSSPFMILNGTYLYGGEQINGRFSVKLAGFGSDWNTVLTSNLQHVHFANKGSYTLVMKYRDGKLDSEHGFFQIAMATDEGTPVKDRYVRFDTKGRKIEGNDSYFLHESHDGYNLITVTFELDDYADYQLRFTIYQRGEITIDDIEIYEGDEYRSESSIDKETHVPTVLYVERFEPTDGRTDGFYPVDAELVANPSQTIRGDHSYLLKNSNEEWTDSLKSDQRVVHLQGGNSYTLAFKYRPTGESEPESFVQVGMNTDVGDFTNNKYLRFTSEGEYLEGNANYHQIETGDDHHTVYATFTLDEYEDYHVVFSLFKDTKVIVDDIVIVQGPFAPPITELDQAESVPVQHLPDPGPAPTPDVPEQPRPVFTPDAIPILVEQFESERYDEWAFVASYGEIVSRQTDILNGSYSYKIRATAEEWTRGLATKSSGLLQPNTRYTATFKYRESGSAGDEGFYMFSARTDSGTFLNDLFVRFDGQGNILDGNVLSMQTVQKDGYIQGIVLFETREFTDYQLAFTVYKQGEIILDDIRLFEDAVYAEEDQVAVAVKEAQAVAAESFEYPDTMFHLNVGQRTAGEQERISGNSSYRFTALADQEWTEGLISKTDWIRFEPQGVYTVAFKYRSLAPTGDEGFYQISFKTADGGYLRDRYVRFDDQGQLIDGNALSYIHQAGDSEDMVVMTVVLDSYDDYVLSYQIAHAGDILLDDIVIYRGFVYDPQFDAEAFDRSRWSVETDGPYPQASHDPIFYNLPGLKGVLSYGNKRLTYEPAQSRIDPIQVTDLTPPPAEVLVEEERARIPYWLIAGAIGALLAVIGAMAVIIRRHKTKTK